MNIQDALLAYQEKGLLNDLILIHYRELEGNFAKFEESVKKEFSPIWNRRIFTLIKNDSKVKWIVSSPGVDLLIQKEKKFQYIFTFSNEGNDPSVTFRWKGSRFSITSICGNKEQIISLIHRFCYYFEDGFIVVEDVKEIKT